MEIAVHNLWTELQALYQKVRVVKSDEIPQNDRLRVLAKTFLDIVGPSKRLNPLVCSVLVDNSHNVMSWKAVSSLMFALEQYTINLLTHPWKKEFHKIITYSGFYKTRIEDILPSDALEKLFSLLDYQRSKNSFVLRTLIDRERLKCLSMEFYLAALECENYHGIFDAFHVHGMTSADAMKSRNEHKGSLQSCYNMLHRHYLQTNKLQSTPVFVDSSVVTDSPNSEARWINSALTDEISSVRKSNCREIVEDVKRSRMLNENSRSVMQEAQIRKEKIVQKECSHDAADCTVFKMVERNCDIDPAKGHNDDICREQDANSERSEVTKSSKSKALTRVNHSQSQVPCPYDDQMENQTQQFGENTTSRQFGDVRQLRLQSLREPSCRTTYEQNSTSNVLPTTQMLHERLSNREKYKSDFFNKNSENKLDAEHPDDQLCDNLFAKKHGRSLEPNKMDGKQEAIVPVQQVWQCNSCTYANDSSSVICAVCYASRDCAEEEKPLETGGKECQKCTFINSRSASNCEICQQDLEGSSTYV